MDRDQIVSDETRAAHWPDFHLNNGMVVKDGRRFDPDAANDEGSWTVHLLGCGNLEVFRSKMRYLSDYETQISGPDLIKIGFTKTSRLHLQFGMQKVEHFLDYSSSIIAQPAGMIKRQRAICGTLDESAVLIIRPELLDLVFPVRRSELPEPLKQFMQGKLDEFFWDHYPMTASMQRCLQDIIDIDPGDSHSDLLVELKSLDLFYQFVNLIGKRDPANVSTTALTSKDRARLREVRNLLSQTFAAPPGLNELAAAVGICRSKLVAGFKQEFGTTIGAFCLEQRMAEAFHLITTSDAPLGSIGFAVGYDHPSSFTSAYRAYFGRPPREDRVGS